MQEEQETPKTGPVDLEEIYSDRDSPDIVDLTSGDNPRSAATAFATTIEIIIEGLALLRPVPDTPELQILFPHAPNHRLRLTVEKTRGIATSTFVEDLAFRNRIRLISTNAVSAIPTGFDNTKIIDIADLHRHVSPINPIKMRPKPPEEEQIDLSYLSIPSVQYYGRSLTPDLRPHKFWAHVPITPTPTRTFIRTSQVAKTIGVNFRLESSSQNLEILLSEPINVSYPLSYDPTANVKYVVTFDNSCHDHPCGADFGYYYEILDGSGIEIEEFPPRIPAAKIKPSDTQAACNPVKGDTGCDLGEYFSLPPNTNCPPQ